MHMKILKDLATFVLSCILLQINRRVIAANIYEAKIGSHRINVDECTNAQMYRVAVTHLKMYVLKYRTN